MYPIEQSSCTSRLVWERVSAQAPSQAEVSERIRVISPIMVSIFMTIGVNGDRKCWNLRIDWGASNFLEGFLVFVQVSNGQCAIVLDEQ